VLPHHADDPDQAEVVDNFRRDQANRLIRGARRAFDRSCSVADDYFRVSWLVLLAAIRIWRLTELAELGSKETIISSTKAGGVDLVRKELLRHGDSAIICRERVVA